MGTNLGDRKTNLQEALKRLSKRKIYVTELSSVFESEPWGISDQPWFWNMVVEVQTGLHPLELLNQCLETEREMGRVRKQKWGERMIDIDILYFKDEIIKEVDLEIPHPGIPERKFTLMPLAEKWEKHIHPILRKNQCEMFMDLVSSLECRKTNVVLSCDAD